MSIIISVFLMAYLLVVTLLSVLTVFWATSLIFKPEPVTKTARVRSQMPNKHILNSTR